MATLLSLTDDPFKKKQQLLQPVVKNTSSMLGQSNSAANISTAASNQPKTTSFQQNNTQNTLQSAKNNVNRSSKPVNTITNFRGTTLTPTVHQFQPVRKSLYNNQNQQDDWFNQVSDSNKLRQLYDEEFSKAKKQNNIFQNMLDNGQTTARAKTNAINRYNQDLLKRAYDDDGKIVDQSAYDELKGKSAALGSQTAQEGNALSRSITKKIGADDMDQSFDERLYNTLETVNNMDMPGAVLGADDTTKFGVRDAAGFLGNLPVGIATAPISGVRNAGRAISGQGRDAETGEMTSLSGVQRLGAGLSAGVDLISPFVGGSGSLLKSLASSGAKQAGKEVAKSGAKEFIKRLAKEAAEEAGEEAFQNLAEELNENGKWDEGTLGRTAEAAMMGALGSGIMTGAGAAIDAGKAKLNQRGGLRGIIDEARSNTATSYNSTNADIKNQIDTYYKQYGQDFYDKLPNNLQANYDTMLDNVPRAANGTYTDPITGEMWIDESIGNRAKNSLETLKNIMSGNDAQRLAYAGADGDIATNKAMSTNQNRNFTVIKGGAPDGSNLVKTDYNLPKNVSINEVGQAIRDIIGKRFQGKKLKVGNTDTKASITAKTRNEMGYQQKNMANNDFVKKGSMVGNLDELIENMQGVRKVKNHKTDKKPNVDHYLSGRVAVDLGDGKTYYPRVDIEVSKNGNAIGYNIADIKEFPRSRSQESPLSATNSLVDDTGTHSRTSNISQNIDDVNKNSDLLLSPDGERITDGRSLGRELSLERLNDMQELKSYHKKYGEDFYEHLPDELQESYDKMLDNVPRDRSGRYTDPITGEKWIDESIGSNNTEIDTEKYVKSQVAAQKAENKTPIKQKVQDSIDNLKHYLVDDAVAYERYVKDKGDRLNLREGIDRVRTSDTIAKQMIEDSGLAETIGKMKTAEADEFQQYLIAKRSQELKRTKGEDFKTGRNDAADQALIKSVGNKYAAQEKVVREFNKKMLDYAVDTGLISKKLRNQLVKDNTDYVPMNRVLDDMADMGMHKSKQLANLGKQTAVQKIEGSDRIVQNPLESMIRNAIRTVNEGERNKVAKALSETAAFREARLPEGGKPKPGNDKLSFIVNGEKVSYEVPALVAKEMKNLNGVMPDFAQNVLTVLGAPTKVLRTGATGANPMFAISNLVRDQLQTTITGNLKTNLKGTPKALQATFGIGKEGKAMQAELARNGIIGSEYRQTYGYKSGELVKELQQAHQLPKQAWQKLKHPVDTLADVIGKTEYFTRAQQYFGTDGTVAEKSQAARNNTLNFGRAGSTVRVLNKVIPFLNAGVQGGRITVNQFKERPVRTTIAVATFAGLAAAVRGVNSAQNQELWDRIGDEEKQGNLIIFGEDAHYDPETNRVVGIIKVPLPQMVYPITDAVNNLKGKPEDLMMLGGDVFTAVTGVDANNPVNQLLPTAIKPFVETAMNKNTYTGQEIVSDYDSNLNPEDKGKKYTTGVARSVAKVTGVDAPIIDNFIQNWGGGLFKDLTKVMTDNPDNKSDGGGVGEIFSQGAFRRFMSASVESQYDIQATLAADYKNQLKANPAFQALDTNEQKKALDRIDTDIKAIAGYAAKTEQGRTSEITSDLSKRQKTLMENGFDVSNYNKPSTSSSRGVEISESISSKHKQILDQYNSMEKEDWEKYIYSAEGRGAEYKLAAAKLENDKANGSLTEVQELKREKELRKLKVSQAWDKNVRDAYSLAGSKTDMQALLGELDNREDMVGYLNALNWAMYEAGVITETAYKTRNRNINNLESSKGKKKSNSAYSNATKTALAAYTKALAGGNSIKVNKSAKAPSTSRRMSALEIATSIKQSKLGAQAKVSVKKGIK